VEEYIIGANYRMVSHKRKRVKKRGKTRRRQRFYFIGGTGTDKCIFVPFSGGLGNQMYIYAAAVMVKKKLGLPLCFLNAKNNPHKVSEEYTAGLFKQGSSVNAEEVKGRMNGSNRILEKVKDPHNTWVNSNIDGNTSRNITLAGAYFQNYSSILPVIPMIREEFASFFKEKYKDVTIDSSGTAFMHVRRGDYGSTSLPAEYYNKGLAIIEPSEAIKNLYIVSDDIAWCKAEKWTTTKNCIYLEDPDELKTMYIMSMCLAGAIISASTFSSWGAILGADQNPESVIVYPAAWISGPSSRLQFPERWKAI
jgi:hypothetical protein